MGRGGDEPAFTNECIIAFPIKEKSAAAAAAPSFLRLCRLSNRQICHGENRERERERKKSNRDFLAFAVLCIVRQKMGKKIIK